MRMPEATYLVLADAGLAQSKDCNRLHTGMLPILYQMAYKSGPLEPCRHVP